jgi:hypothetical protein
MVPPGGALGINALLDRGCEANFMDLRHWDRLAGQQGDRGILEPTDVVITLNSKRFAVAGIARGVLWQLSDGYRAYSADFHIIEMSEHDVIIGEKSLMSSDLLTSGIDIAHHLSRTRKKEQARLRDLRKRSPGEP